MNSNYNFTPRILNVILVTHITHAVIFRIGCFKMWFEGLPPEYLIRMLKHLPPAAVLAMASTSKSVGKVATDPILWKKLYQQGMGRPFNGPDNYTSIRDALLTELNATWEFLSQPHLAEFTRYHFPGGRNSLTISLHSSSPKGPAQALLLLEEITSHYEDLMGYPEPTKTLFTEFLQSLNTSFPLHGEEKEIAFLKKRYERLLLILEYGFLKEPNDSNESDTLLPETFNETDESLVTRFNNIRDNELDEEKHFWEDLDATFEEINTSKLVDELKDSFPDLPQHSDNLTVVVAVNRLLSQSKWRSLELDSEEFTRLPRIIGKMTLLQRLHVLPNKLLALPKEIGNLVALRSLTIIGNRLRSLPIEIGTLVNLRELTVNNNRLRSLPNEIGTLVNLKTLAFNYNRLRSLPVAISNLGALDIIFGSGNRFTSLPMGITNLANLQSLVMERNKFRSLPKTLASLPKLETFNFDIKSIRFLPYSLKTFLFGTPTFEVGSLQVFLGGSGRSAVFHGIPNKNIIWTKEVSTTSVIDALKKITTENFYTGKQLVVFLKRINKQQDAESALLKESVVTTLRPMLIQDSSQQSITLDLLINILEEIVLQEKYDRENAVVAASVAGSGPSHSMRK